MGEARGVPSNSLGNQRKKDRSGGEKDGEKEEGKKGVSCDPRLALLHGPNIPPTELYADV